MQATGTIEVRRIAADQLIPRKPEDYVDVGLVGFLDKLAFGPNLILKGAKGSGKSLAIEVWAAEHEIPLLRQDCCEDTGVRDLVGSFSLEGESVFFQLGALAAAVDVANEVGACVLVLEEINALPPAAQKVLNSIADYRQEISIPKIGRVFRLGAKQRVWVMGTMNPNYTGTYNLNEDMRSRFEFVEVNYMGIEQERDLLTRQFPSKPNAQERQFIDHLLNLARETRSGQLEYGLSTRDLVQVVRNFVRTGNLDAALKLLEGKFEGENVKNFRTRIMSTFRINLDTVRLYG